ncbi:hypothetical protein Phou_091320 [Phytohabitans houttuyneae]|uniref:TraD/TraG TraM recognition site domain-containing protein n=1 Tax=Phytohabitans houttuyneae TaxID=1076126 RepID=A0A6V8KIC8_9ACTN|nr:hypothetical protein Phou_091320 [Phytohabitans houttuyneae]
MASHHRSRPHPEDDRPDASVILDECHNFLHLPIGIDDALAEARGLHTSFVLAHQYLGQLSGEMAEAIDANARNKVYFALAPRDATAQARQLRPYLDDGDLIRLGGYEVVLRPVAGGRIVPPVTADTEPPPRRSKAVPASCGGRPGSTPACRWPSGGGCSANPPPAWSPTTRPCPATS